MKRICCIYKSPKEQELYLYVDHHDKLENIPKPLLDHFGSPVLVTTLLITPEKKLARADSVKVLSEISEKGFYLQMPPAKKEDYA